MPKGARGGPRDRIAVDQQVLIFGLTVETLDRTVLPEHGFFADLNLEWTDETVATSFMSQKSTLYVFIGPVL